MYNIRNITTQRKTWRDMLAEINAAQKEWNEYSGIMTAYERETAKREYNNMLDKYSKPITAGVLAVHENALQKLKQADDRVKAEKKKETASWEAARLASEMQVYEMLIRQAIHSDGPRENTGKKLEQKKYYSHSGYPGGLKVKTLKEILERKPEEVVRKAVWGMIPKGKLGRAVYKKLKVYKGSDHPHEAQKPQEYRF